MKASERLKTAFKTLPLHHDGGKFMVIVQIGFVTVVDRVKPVYFLFNVGHFDPFSQFSIGFCCL